MGDRAVRTCSLCGTKKMPIDFYRRSNGTFRSECKVCSDATTTRNRLRRLSGELPVVVPEVKTCCRCKVTKPHTAFHRHAGKPDGLHVACKACRAAGGRRSKYGISQSEFDELLVRQTGRCAICSEPMPRPAVDHCHTVGAVRGLLCSPCNTGLGHFKDSPARLLAAIQYLGYALGNNH